MRKLIVGAFVTLDGVMQAPGGPDEDRSGGFDHGGWVVPHSDETTGKFIDEIFAEPFDLLLGRKTYDIFAAYWPHAGPDHPIGALFNRVTKYVATRNPAMALEWQNSQTLGADAEAAVRKLKDGDGPHLLTQGSADFLRTLFAAGLVDELRLSLFPIILGKGKKLFAGGAAPAAFKLTGSRASASGVTLNKYVRAGEVTTGSFALADPTEAELARRGNAT